MNTNPKETIVKQASLSILLATFVATSLTAAETPFRFAGTVVDETLKPLAGAKVAVIGADRAATTDAGGKFVFTPDLRVIDLATGKVLGQGKGPRINNGGYMQAIEDLVLVREDGSHGSISCGFYKIGADGSVVAFTDKPWYPPIGGGTTSYHHPLFYPLVDGRIFLRQQDGIYCWDVRQALK